MAGRPKTMAKRVTELFERVSLLYDDLHFLTPSQYRDGAHSSTEVGQLWKFASEAAFYLCLTLDELGDNLRYKAGIVDQKSGEGLATPEKALDRSGDDGDEDTQN